MCGFRSDTARIFAGLILCVFHSHGGLRAYGQDSVDAQFRPVIRGPGTVQALLWNPDGFAYAAINADKINPLYA
jgi:hypothetical protein